MMSEKILLLTVLIALYVVDWIILIGLFKNFVGDVDESIIKIKKKETENGKSKYGISISVPMIVVVFSIFLLFGYPVIDSLIYSIGILLAEELVIYIIGYVLIKSRKKEINSSEFIREWLITINEIGRTSNIVLVFMLVLTLIALSLS